MAGFASKVDAKVAAASGKDFVLALKQFTGATKEQMNLFPKAIAMRIFADIIMATPVDTGRARANWMMSIGTLNTTITYDVDENGQPTVDKGVASLSDYKGGQSIFITNSLPYIMRLEYGWSKQAPNGMVRQAISRFRKLIPGAVAASKQGKIK